MANPGIEEGVPGRLKASGSGGLTPNLTPLTPQSILIVAGEPSGDQLAAELVLALRKAWGPVPPRFFGAGGTAMADAGVEIRHNLTGLSAIGPADALRQYSRYRDAFDGLLRDAVDQTPAMVIGVDFGAFNLRLARAIRGRATPHDAFHNWSPRIIQFVSPQVWASRPGRAQQIGRTHDLLLSILPFEAAWYADHAPSVKVRFVGHPLVDRHGPQTLPLPPRTGSPLPRLVLLPGSRAGELRRHWPVVAAAAAQVQQRTGAESVLVLPSDSARGSLPAGVKDPPGLRIRIGGLAEELRAADVAIASTGTVTLECAWFQVPTVALYRTSWSTYQIGRRIIQVPHLALPNLLAERPVIPEFIQDAATPEALAGAAIRFLEDRSLREETRAELGRIRSRLGEPGACARAADAILQLR